MSSSTEHPDVYWMRRVLALARRGLGTTQPNPMVGAIVLDSTGSWIGSGYHEKAGEPHAEVIALGVAGEAARGGTLFLNLEPCTFHGRTPPCIDRVIQSGVRSVVIACKDPNPRVNGAGISQLKRNGIHVRTGVLEKEAREFNRAFETYIVKKRPSYVAKVALSQDGKIGRIGTRVVLSGAGAERTTMKLRAEAGAIVVGVDTITTDNPRLTVRGTYSQRKPIRVILDPSLRTPRESRIFKEDGGRIWLVHDPKRSADRIHNWRGTSAELLEIETGSDGVFNLEILNSRFYAEGISCVLIEGGSKTLQRFANGGWIDRWFFYSTPHLLGPKRTIPLALDSPFPLKIRSVIRRGADWIFAADVEKG